MCRGFANTAWMVLALALVPVAAQVPARPAAPSEEMLADALPLSQPGAQGRALPDTQPPVPVPPGPVPAHEIKPAPPTPIAVKKVELGSPNTWDPRWDVLIEEQLPPELLQADMAEAVRPFCPRFGQLSDADKRAFWAYLFQALAGAEAGLRPTADVKHLDPTVAIPDKVSHRITRQQGLLQLTYEDNKRYGCDFDWDKDKHLPVGDPAKSILQPDRNLSCGLKIMKNQLIDLNRPLISKKSYWGTLRPGTRSFQVFANQMANVPMACGVKAVRSKKLDRGGVRMAAGAAAPEKPGAAGTE